MKRFSQLCSLILSLMLLLSCVIVPTSGEESSLLIEGDTITYKKTPNADGTTYTVTISDPTGDGVIPSMNPGYDTTPWFTDTAVSTVIFDETIKSVGTFTVVLQNQHNITDIYFYAPTVSVGVNGVVDYSNNGKKATVHAYSTWSYTLSAKFAGVSYFEAEEFMEEYTALWTLETSDAAAHTTAIKAANEEFATLPSVAQAQLSEQKKKLDTLNAALNGETPEVDDSKLLFPDDTITVEKLLNTDGVTYTVVISDPTGDGALPARVSDERRDLPWHDADVTVIIFDETITSIVTTTVELLNKHQVKEIHFKAPEVKTTVNCVVDYSNEPGRQATVYAYSTWTYSLSAKFAGLVYYEAKEFIDSYASLWTLDVADAPFYEKDIAAAVTAYTSIPTVAKTQLSTEKAKLDELSEAIGLETPEVNENLLFDNDTVLFEKTLNADGTTYTVTVSDPMGDGILPDLSNISATMPWHAYDVTAVIFDETIVGISTKTINLTNSHILKDIYFKAPYVSTPANAIVDYSNAPGRQATVHAYSTFTYTLSEKFAGVVFYETQDFIDKHTDVWSLSTSDATANRSKITAAIADYMKLTVAVQEQLAEQKAQLDTLGAALGLSGTSGSIAYLIDDVNHILQITGSGALEANASWNAFKDSIQTVVVGEGITSVTTGAFSGFTALKSVDLPFSITSIQTGAFPTTSFEVFGWLNHTIGQFAEANDNVSLKVKELRILSIGNSHTLNYTSFFADIINDLKAGLDTAITHERIVTGSRRLVSRDASATTGNHYDAAHNLDNVSGVDYPDSTDYNRYVAAFAKTWDIVIVQDYRESTQFGATFAEEMPKVMEWLHEDAEGAKIVWFADWVENLPVSTFSYTNSIAAVNAVEALDEGDKPDYIVVASTIIENARNTYFSTSMNPDGICSSKPGTGSLPILESDGAHMSYELGQYMLGNAVMYQILSHFGDLLPIDESFDYFALQKTDPVNADWIGEFVPEYRPVIKEICINSYKTRLTETASTYTVDPAIAKHEALLTILKNVAVPKTVTANTLSVLYKSGAVVNAINALGFSIEASDITVSYDENAGTYTVFVDCQYGYTVSEGVTYTASVSSSADKSAAKIGSTSYATLKEAIEKAESNNTVILLDHAVLTEALAIDKALTVDLNGFEITATSAVFSLSSGASLTLKNGTVTTYGSKSYVISSNEAASITVQDATLTAYNCAVIYHTAKANNVTVLIKNATLSSESKATVYLADQQTANGSFNTLVIDNATLTGKSAIDAKRTNITVKNGSAVTATVSAAMLTGFKKSGAVGYAIAISGNGENSVGSITVTSGTFKGIIGAEPAAEGYTNAVSIAISGGKFNTPVPEAYCAEGYTPTENADGTYGVTDGQVSEHSDADVISFQVTKSENDTFSIRVIAGTDSLNYKLFGYEVTITATDANGIETVSTMSGTDSKAYSAIYGGNTSYRIKDIFGYEYACLATITELDATLSRIELDIRAYVTTGSGVTQYGAGAVLVYEGASDASGYPAIVFAK